MLFYVALYFVIHLGTTAFRAFQRANKYYYYYLAKGLMPFPRSFAKRFLDGHTFLYALLISLGLFALMLIVQFIDQITQV